MVYAFGGYMISSTNNLLYLMAAATVPWALAAVLANSSQRRWASWGWASCLLALVLFAGDAQGFALTCLCAIGLAAPTAASGQSLRDGLRASGLAGAALLLGAIQVLPSLAIREEVSAFNQTAPEAMAWSLHPLRLLELVLGPIFGREPGEPFVATIADRLLSTSRTMLWANSIHIGVLAMALAFAALWAHRRKGPVLIAVLGALLLALLALGKHTPLYELAFRWLPFWRPFRYPEKITPFVLLAVAVAAAFGLDALTRIDRPRLRAAGGLALTGLGLALVGVGEYAWGVVSKGVVGPLFTGPPAEGAVEWIGSRVITGCVTAALAAGLGALVLFRASARLRAPLLVSLAFAEVWAANGQIYQAAPGELFNRRPKVLAEVERMHGGIDHLP